MATDTEDAQYSDIAIRAESAVAGVQDPDLKRIAFQKILETMLAGGKPEGRPEATNSHRASSNSDRRAKKDAKTSKPKGGPKAYVEELIADHFFKAPKSIADVRSELENRGHHIPVTSLSGPLQSLCKQKKLRRRKDGETGAFTYSNW